MGLSYRFFVCFLLLGGTELCFPQTTPDKSHPSLPSSPPVVVECLEAQLVVTVSKNLFGTGKLVRPADLTLGPENCEPLLSVDTDDVVKFEVGLHKCGNSVQVRLGPLGGPGEFGCRADPQGEVGLGQIPFVGGREWLRPEAGHW